MKVTFIPAPGSGAVEETPSPEQAPGRVTQRDRIPETLPPELGVKLVASPSASSLSLAQTDPDILMPPVETSVYRSVNRPAMAVLTVLDDGSRTDGEQVRIRTDRFVIGRTTGNYVISHDPDVSGSHAEITREAHGLGFHWYLTDLKSTNGTFLQVRRVVLRHGQELLLGGRRYEFQAPCLAMPETAGPQTDRTRRSFGQWQGVANLLQPRLVQLTPAGEGSVYPVRGETMWIGADSHCEICISGDPFLSGQHARISRDKSGRWVLTDCESLNGILVRVNRVSIEGERRFQLGGQRFLLRIL